MVKNNSGVIKKKNRWVYVVFASVIIGLLAVAILTVGINQYTNTVTVLAASKELPPFTIITPQDLKEIKVPKNYADNKTSNKNMIVGRITRTTIPGGTAIQQEYLVPKDNENILAAKLTDLKDSKLRAFAIPLNGISGCGGKIEPGDFVDIIGSFKIMLPKPEEPKKPGEGQEVAQQTQSQDREKEEVISKLLAGQVMVIETLGKEQEIGGAIVAVEPQQAQEIQFAIQAGKISVALNPYNPDAKASQTKTTTVKSFIEKYAKDLLKD